MKKLTIAIPTYNRNTLLHSNLTSILKQNLQNVTVLIVDNCSEIPVETTLKNEIESFGDAIRLVRNNVNLGLAGNFVKCMELCDTKWMWLLSDDDFPLEKSIEVVFNALQGREDYTYINFSTKEWTDSRKQTFETIGINEFICKLDSFQNLLFFSSGVYNVSLLAKSLRFAVMYSMSAAPHLALLLNGIALDGRVLFSSSELVEWKHPDANDRWSMIPMSLGLLNLLHLPMPVSQVAFKTLAIRLVANTLTPRAAFFNLLLFSRDFKSHAQLRYVFHLIFSLRRPFVNLREYIEFTLLRILIQDETLFNRIAQHYLSRRESKKQTDRFNRI